MSMTLEQLAHIAHLARLNLPTPSDHEHQPAMLEHLHQFFHLVEQMQSVSTEGIEPLAHPVALMQSIQLRLAEDVPQTNVDREAMQRNAPAVEQHLFLVPKVIE